VAIQNWGGEAAASFENRQMFTRRAFLLNIAAVAASGPVIARASPAPLIARDGASGADREEVVVMLADFSFRPAEEIYASLVGKSRVGRSRSASGGLLLLLATVIVATAANGQAISPDALVRAYPDHVAGADEVSLQWRDGARQPLSDGRPDKSFEEKLRRASLLDQLSLPYKPGPLSEPPGQSDDPGRFRNAAFFDKMYGDCDRGEAQKHLVDIPWVGGRTVRVTTVNGVAEKLRAIRAELDRLPPNLKRFAYPSAGAFNCRVVKDTGARSMHAYGAALDIGVAQADYWLWRKGAYRNRIPYEIVEVFERHGFIWGGKWGHFDTMHFEYRPEFFVSKDKAK